MIVALGLSRDPGDPNSGGNHRMNLTRSMETSLKQLDTDRMDLLYLHAWMNQPMVQHLIFGGAAVQK